MHAIVYVMCGDQRVMVMGLDLSFHYVYAGIKLRLTRVAASALLC